MNCALCNKEAALIQSHIIPKFIYDRIKAYPQSRFRALNQPKRAMQAGEVYPMLCHDCEERFSALERQFSLNFIEPLFNNHELPDISMPWLENYQVSVAWRTLYDDLHRLNSYDASPLRSIFEKFEQQMATFLNTVDHTSTITDERFKNYRFYLPTIISDPKAQEIMKSVTFTYSYFHGPTATPMVVSYYADVIYLTIFKPNNKADRLFLYGDEILKDEMIIDIACDEIYNEILQIKETYPTAFTPELRQKIKQYKDKHCSDRNVSE